MLHAKVENDDTAGLDEEQQQAVLTAMKERDKLIASTFPGVTELERVVEERSWRPGDLWSGKADLIASDGKKTVLCIDYKFGRGQVSDPEGNLQLTALAVLAADKFNEATDFIIAIIQPRAFRPVRVARLTRPQVAYARAMLDHHSRLAMSPNQPRKAGRWCAYCPLKKDGCPEYEGYALAVSSYDIQSLDNLNLVLQRLPDLKGAVEAIEKRAREILASGGEIPGGWKLVRGKPTVDGISGLLAESFGYKGKELKGAVDTLLDGIVDVKAITSNRRTITDANMVVDRLRAAGVEDKAIDVAFGKVVRES